MSTGFALGRCTPPAPVEAPPPGTPNQFGLFSASRMLEAPPAHELNGVEYEPVCSTQVDEWPIECAPYRDVEVGDDGNCGRVVEPMPHIGRDEGPSEPYLRKLFRHSKSVTSAVPFGVYAGEDCFLGNHDSSQALSDLQQRFLLGEQTTVEHVIYNGAMGVYPALRYKPVILTAEGKNPDPPVVPVGDGIGLLEHWLACTSGAAGVIHVPRFMATALGAGQESRSQGPRAVTAVGNAFVFGTGYSGAAPFGDDGPVPEEADRVWIYATRPVTVRRSALIQPATYGQGAFSQARNEASLLYERLYVVDWPCEVAAIQVDFPRYQLNTKTTEEFSESS